MHHWFYFGWWDLLDILVVSFVIHRLLVLLRGTAALQVMLGLVFLWLAEAVARTVGLVLTSWLLRGLGAVAVLVIIVVFRNELRELFLRTNPLRFFLGHYPALSELEFGPVADSAFRLAESKTGALIVLEGKEPVSAYLREGVHLDSRLDSRIIEAIFSKESPVHDGAIIVRGNRISRAGTFLPLTQREDLPQQYGTRHRAGLGLAETSDAVILIVSEERGTVSVAHGRNIEPVHDQQDLEETLKALFDGDRKTEKTAHRKTWLSYSAGLLLTFLLVAAFWGVYGSRPLSLVSTSTVIDFRNVPEDMVVRSVSAEKIEVQVSGKQLLINDLDQTQIRGFLDLSALTPGTHQLVLDRDNIELPVGLEVVRVRPDSIDVVLERIIEKELRIEPKIIGISSSRIQIEVISPKSVRVRGPESTLERMTRLFSQQINLSETDTTSGSVIIETPISVSPPSLRLMEGESDSVRVHIDFLPEEGPEQKRLYRVVPGDTLWEISRRYGVAVEKIRQLNRLRAEDQIQPGQVLDLGPAGEE